MIELDRVTKRYGSSTVVDDLSLAIRDSEFCVIVGSSGAGKSTALKMINQLIPPSAGTVRIDGKDAATVAPEELRRRMGYVIQSIGLFPHWTVERNIGAVPTLLGWPAAKIRERTRELLALLKLDPESFRRKYPHQLSIGQQQRVGIARALAADPDVLLMDEPFGALDPITRDALQSEIARIHRESRKTIVFVTHDMEEALKLASRIAVMDRGRLIQAGTPLEILASPANDFVRDLVGQDEVGIRLLSVATVADRLRRGDIGQGPSIAATATLRQALSRMIAEHTDRLAATDAEGRPIGALHLADIVRR
ncbi:MAG TPA: ABC transporter ATP-binding protein [Stellaceae bacterium]|nr:ABC transporter ATP-binding protein [Stellaceae bacterium]